MTAAGHAASGVRDTAFASALAASAAALGAAAAYAAANTFASETALASDAAAVTAADAGAAAEFAAQAIAVHAAANSSDATAAWHEVRADAEALERTSNKSRAVQPLWSMGIPNWALVAWSKLKFALPRNEDWGVWIDWYEERLRGGSRSEAYELVFASVPLDVWDKGPAAANAWIKAHLPTVPEPARPGELPEALSGLDAPFAYAWTASQRVAAVAGAQNLPFYPHFSSEEDHRHALEACRIGGERLLKALRDGRYNARPEYGEALEYYLDDLPKTAGVGNILLANDQIRILHAMFLADAPMLPEGFASRLKSVIANQFALNAFYDLVQRHNEAVGAGNWSQPFPLDAARGFFGAVADNTPRWFEREVNEGLRHVEQAQPPAAALPEPTGSFSFTPPDASITLAGGAPASAIEPPPLPPGTPDAQNSWRRQMATAANALWETFLQGRDMPVDTDEWREAAEKLGANVRPLIDFLRALDAPKA